MRAHICLVSEQVLPNVIPVLSEKVDHVILLFSPEMERRRDLLQRFFKERGYMVSEYKIDAYDFNKTLTICEEMLEANSDTELTLNVTGGTKIAALAAWQQCWFSARQVRIIYVDTENLLLHQLGDSVTSEPLPANLLSVKDHLLCLGKKMLKGDAPQGEKSRRPATTELAAFLVHNLELQRRLNAVIADYREKEKKRKAPPYLIVEPRQFNAKGKELCRILVQTGVGIERPDGGISLNSREARFYVGGGWLEEYVYGCIADMRISGLDLRMNVEFTWQEAGEAVKKNVTKNELDVVFTWHNRLHVISCKTSAIDQSGGAVKGKDVLYELDSLYDKVGGIYARAILVSAHPLNKTSRQRAEELKIEIIAGNELLRLAHHLEQKWNIREPQREEQLFS